jgi:inorganic phosphate transporter, PiT family
MATSIASGAPKPKSAVALSAVLNLVGAFLSTAVAATIAKGLVDADLVTLELVFAGLVGGITWNLLTWLLGIPSSSSHALIGGIVGALTYFIVHGIGGFIGTLIGFTLLLTASTLIWLKSRKPPIDHHNVNDEWEGSLIGHHTGLYLLGAKHK